MSLGQLLAEGRTAEIYAWEDGWVLKLFRDGYSEGHVQYEARIGRAVYAAGLPVPAIGDIVEVEGRTGLLCERLDGPTMAKVIQSRPRTPLRCARQLAELQAKVHAIDKVPKLPSQRERLQSKIQGAQGLSERLRAAALSALEGMPDGNRLCHGDLHPENVVLTAQGAVVIDWIDATVGNPLADVARTSVILLGVGDAGGVPLWVARPYMRWFHRAYLRRYQALRPGGEDERRRWLPIVAAGRMSEGIAEIESWLHSQVERGLA